MNAVMQKGKTMSVLVVDDDKDLASSLKEMLEYSGYQADIAGTREKCAVKLQEARPDICIIDIRLGNENGIEVLQYIKNTYPEIECVILTAYASMNTAVRAMKLGAYDYIEKPIDEDDFMNIMARCSSVIRLSREKQHAEIQLKQRNHDLEVVNRQLKSIITSANAITAHIESDDLYKTICRELQKQFDASLAAIVVKKGNIVYYNSTAQQHETPVAAEYSESVEGFISELLKRVQPFVSIYKPESEFDIAVAGSEVQSILSVPLFDVNHRVIGVLLQLKENFELPNELILDLCSLFASLSSDAIQASWNARELKEREREQYHNQKIEAIGRLAGGVAHDFNNLLTAIIGYTELIEVNDSTPSDFIDYIREIRTIVDHGASLTQQLLAFSRKDYSQPSKIDLVKIVAKSKSILDRLIDERINLQFNIDRNEPVIIYADEKQLMQVILNLVINARDAIAGVGTISVSVSAGGTPAEQKAILEVSDTGKGMDKDTVSHVFEPFFTTKEENRGSGLGLSTVFGIIKKINGEIKVYSEPDRGAWFTISLPIFAADEE